MKTSAFPSGRSLLVAASLGALLASTAQAAPPRKSPEREAKKACLTGNVEKGVAILAELYVETDDPTWLFNQGRCFEQNTRHVEAISRFKEYLRKATNLSQAERTEAESHIAECETALAFGLSGGLAKEPGRLHL